jgi:hypothetical protein
VYIQCTALGTECTDRPVAIAYKASKPLILFESQGWHTRRLSCLSEGR